MPLHATLQNNDCNASFSQDYAMKYNFKITAEQQKKSKMKLNLTGKSFVEIVKGNSLKDICVSFPHVS